MGRPLEGVKIVELAIWAFVPAAGGMLSDLGADVIKVEPPTGDPLRGLEIGGIKPGGRNLSWESYNRGKKSVTLDVRTAEGHAVLMKLLEGADVFLTNLRVPARKAMGIDAETIRARFSDIIYASGSGTGPNGPESANGGYDAITFWARGGVSSSLTEEEADYPVGPPGPAFGDTLSGAMLAGAICAAIAKRALSGETSIVDVSLLGTAMWSMQRYITQSAQDEVRRFPRPRAPKPNNILYHNYRTADGRFVALGMLQPDKYWARFCDLAGRPEWVDDPRFKDAPARRANLDTCFAAMKELFAGKPLAEWKQILSRQDGPWDVVQDVGELAGDVQVQANALIQSVRYSDVEHVPVVSVPMLFDGAPMQARPSPELGADSDTVLAGLGYDEDAIIDFKIKGVVF